jgi:hypothetical protein
MRCNCAPVAIWKAGGPAKLWAVYIWHLCCCKQALHLCVVEVDGSQRHRQDDLWCLATEGQLQAQAKPALSVAAHKHTLLCSLAHTASPPYTLIALT